MQPQTLDREVTSTGVQRAGKFGISFNDAAFLMRILRDTLYSDKELAVVREYSANAWDAHREVGKDDVPIRVVLPTELEPMLVIRDFGRGLSLDDVYEVYTQYAASTKRGDDVGVGMYGIGCKSGFAYSDSFTVISYHGGIRRTFIAALDKDDLGDFNLVDERPCGDETGVEIRVAVRPADVRKFQTAASNLFPFFRPFPEIVNNTLDIKPVSISMEKKNGYIGGIGSWGWVAVMGCIPYRIDLDQVSEMLDNEGILAFAENQKGGLYFDIGAVKINASREALEYREETKLAILHKMIALREEVIEDLRVLFEDPNASMWEKRIEARKAVNVGLLPPFEWRHLTKDEVVLYGEVKDGDAVVRTIPEPDTWALRGNNHGSLVNANTLSVQGNARILIRDSERSIRGYADLSRYDRIVTPAGGGHFDPVPKNLVPSIERFLVDAGCDGITIGYLSEQEWEAPRVYGGGGGGAYREKYTVDCFRLDRTNGSPLSTNWGIVAREPEPDDVFVIINRFEAYPSFYDEYNADKSLMDALGIQMPVVYGYKTTQKSPRTAANCVGTEYRVWRRQMAERIKRSHPELDRLARAMDWATANRFFTDSSLRHDRRNLDKAVGMFTEELTASHPIRDLFRQIMWGRKVWKKYATDGGPFTKKHVAHVVKLTATTTNKGSNLTAAGRAIHKIHDMYPLLTSEHGNRWEVFWGSHRKHWFDYIRMVDTMRSEEKA